MPLTLSSIVSVAAPLSFSPYDFDYSITTSETSIDLTIVGSAYFQCNLVAGSAWSSNHSSCQSVSLTVTAPVTVVITLAIPGDSTSTQYTITYTAPAASSSSKSNVGVIAGAAAGGGALLIIVVFVVIYLKKVRKSKSMNIQKFDDADPLVDETL